MDVDEHSANTVNPTGVVTIAGTASRSRQKWAVVNRDSQNQNPVVVTRWRWYAGWWAAWLRISDGKDMRITHIS